MSDVYPLPPLLPWSTALSAFHTQGAAKRARDKVRKKRKLTELTVCTVGDLTIFF